MIVYFDGHCSLCNGLVDFLIRRDVAARLRFAPLQGATARARLPASFVEDLDTVVLQDGERIFTASTAALRTIAALGGAFTMARAFLLVPRSLRDSIYSFIARHRYRWFGRRDTCRRPTAAERARFLD